MKPLTPISRTRQIVLGLAFFILFFAAWAIATFGGFVPRTFLADPITMLREGHALFTQHGFAKDIGFTVWRVLGGFLIAAALAIPLGHRHGGLEAGRGVLRAVRVVLALPARVGVHPAADPLGGIGEAQKLSLIFIGAFFPMVLMIAVKVGATRRDLLEAAYTLGCTDWGVVKRVLLPASAPEIAEILRTVLGWAWTYVIVAELIGSERGIGHMITDSQALLNTGQIIFGILVIGVIGLVSDYAFKAANRRAFAWSTL
jgi:NitT/TauT family transport system permease protein